jgi:hypothetical protein
MVELRVQMRFTIQHLYAAARFSRRVAEVEGQHDDQPFGPWHNEVLQFSFACIFTTVAALEAYANDGRLMLTVLGGLAEFERELIRARTGEGRKRAKDRGVKFGRPRKMTPHQRQEALQRLASGETYADVARTFNVDATTIGRLAASSPFEQSAVGP